MEAEIAKRLDLLNETQEAFDKKQRDIDCHKDSLARREEKLRVRSGEHVKQCTALEEAKADFERCVADREAKLEAKERENDNILKEERSKIASETVSLPSGAVKKKREASVKSPERAPAKSPDQASADNGSDSPAKSAEIAQLGEQGPAKLFDADGQVNASVWEEPHEIVLPDGSEAAKSEADSNDAASPDDEHLFE